MSRPDLAYADSAAAFVAETSEAAIRNPGLAAEFMTALTPLRPMSVAYRRENLLALAQIVVSEHEWLANVGVRPVITPAVRPHVAFFATTDDLDAFGRLLIAVAACNQRDADAALERLVPGEVAA